MSIPQGEDSEACPISFINQLTKEDQECIKANLPLLFNKYRDIFTTFPKEKGWMTQDLYMHQGFWFQSRHAFSVETVMAAQDTFQARPTDVYLATLPKSGTTWLKALAFAIVNRNRYKIMPDHSTHPLHIYNPHDCVPFVETEVLRPNPTYIDGYSPRLFATHIPYTSLPQSIIDSDCRLVYMCRNPKDVLVSLFHFNNKLRWESRDVMTIAEAFERFCRGVVPNGPCWDHVEGYYKASLDRPTRILFLTYEEMRLSTTKNVKRLADFLGHPFTEKEEAEGVVEEIVGLCSFQHLSDVNKNGELREGMPKNAFFREGKVGDWNNHLTKEMGRILDQITQGKFQGLHIHFP